MKTETEIRDYLEGQKQIWEEFKDVFGEGDPEEGKLLGLIEGLEYVLQDDGSKLV